MILYEILEYNHNESDLEDVADWLQTTKENLHIEIVYEPIEKFKKQIIEMYDTYDEFPKDGKRTNRILKMLGKGEKPLPIYVEKNDPYLFVMEGRHRMVAFYLYNMEKIPVAYVSKKEIEERKLSKKEIKKRDKIADKDLPKAEFKKRYGDNWENVLYGTATNMAKRSKK